MDLAATDFDPIRLYDTRRRRTETFVPLEAGKVGIYTCGPTVYAPQTLGNMRSQFTPDLLRRLFRAAGYDVTYVTNITDVGHLVSDADDGDDKVEAAATRTGQTVADITGHYTEQWAEDRRRLAMADPDIRPAASGHIDEQIAMVRQLEERGHTYVIEDGVYFDVSSFPTYGNFAGIDLDALEATGRVTNTTAKRHPADFALWKFSPTDSTRLQEWDSPWGRGFPGWHIECSAMATKYLGENFDIHTGGVDHVRVHHSNEVAQSEAAFGTGPWVNTWMHTEFLDLGGRKISKSDGDTLTVDTLLEAGIDPLAFRYFLLQAHYRQQQTYSDTAIEAAAVALRRLTHHAVTARNASSGNSTDSSAVSGYRAAFWAAIADDLNTPKALAVVSTVLRDPELDATASWSLLSDFDRLLGFGLDTATDPELVGDQSGDPRYVELLEQRTEARAAKNWAEADRIRDEFAAVGLVVVDTADGPVLRES